MSLASFFNQTITHYPRAGYDAYGRERLSSGATYSARFRLESKAVLMPTGEVMQIDAVSIIPSSVTVAVDDRVDYASVSYKIIGVRGAVDGQGNTSHQTVFLKKWQI